MNLNIFTIKAQESVNQAVSIAQDKGQQAIDTAHLLKALLSDTDSISYFLLQKLGANIGSIQTECDKVIDTLPKVSGGNNYLSNSANTAIQKAQEAAKIMG
ncbi:MAG: Clp protease N-terminal domain-containing protein, partial [Bacteroidales bacterium]